MNITFRILIFGVSEVGLCLLETYEVVLGESRKCQGETLMILSINASLHYMYIIAAFIASA